MRISAAAAAECAERIAAMTRPARGIKGSASAQCTSTLPPPSTCSTVAGGLPTQLVENQIPPDPFQSVMPMVSLPPGVPLSVILNCKAPLFPATVDGASGLVMSWMLALPLNCALQGEVEVAPVQPATQALFTH